MPVEKGRPGRIAHFSPTMKETPFETGSWQDAASILWNNASHDTQHSLHGLSEATLLFASLPLQVFPGMRSMALQVRDLARDWQFLFVIACSILTGIVFRLWLPAGYAEPIASDPWLIVSFLLLYPLVEEWVFRGVLQGELLKRAWGKLRGIGISNANLITSIVFVSLHLINHPPGWALAVLVPSLVLGHFRERHESLLPPMLLHPLFNLTYLLAGITG